MPASAFTRFALCLATAWALSGCAGPGHGHAGRADDHAMHAGHDMGAMKGAMAVATLTPTQGHSARGIVMFHEMDGHLMVHAQLSGLKPGADHGFHVHETGSCASADGTSAGGHFNPTGQAHGPQDAAHHAGDMPLLKADAAGQVDQRFMLMGPTVAAGSSSVVGRAVIVHAQSDDYTTQPTGNAGARIGCGVIAAHG